MQQHLQALEKKGYIARDEGVARGIRVLVPSVDAPTKPGPSKTAGGGCRSCPHCGKRVA